jgi:chaperonin cofactor prefoldin
MAEHDVGDKVILKDDGQVYKVVGVRREDGVVLFDLEQGDERASRRLTVLKSQIEVQKAYTPKQPQIVIYKKKAGEIEV